jgi:hypothetical protein
MLMRRLRALCMGSRFFTGTTVLSWLLALRVDPALPRGQRLLALTPWQRVTLLVAGYIHRRLHHARRFNANTS